MILEFSWNLAWISVSCRWGKEGRCTCVWFYCINVGLCAFFLRLGDLFVCLWAWCECMLVLVFRCWITHLCVCLCVSECVGDLPVAVINLGQSRGAERRTFSMGRAITAQQPNKSQPLSFHSILSPFLSFFSTIPFFIFAKPLHSLSPASFYPSQLASSLLSSSLTIFIAAQHQTVRVYVWSCYTQSGTNSVLCSWFRFHLWRMSEGGQSTATAMICAWGKMWVCHWKKKKARQSKRRAQENVVKICSPGGQGRILMLVPFSFTLY